MTLIACLDADHFGAISDIAISSSIKPSNLNLNLPARGNTEISKETVNIVSASQKSVVKNNTLVLWSGSEIISKYIINEAFKNNNNGIDDFNIVKFIEKMDISEKEKKSVSIIYTFIDEHNGNIYNDFWNCMSRSDLGEEVIYAGSGGWDFFDASKYGRLDRESLFSKAAMNIWYEQYSNSFYNFGYGGWFELIGINSEYKMEKIPYAIKNWVVRDGQLLYSEPLIFSWYEDDALYICHIKDVAIEETQHFTFFQIEGILRDRKINNVINFKYDPKITFHMVRNSDTNTLRTRCDMGGDQEFKFTIENNRYNLAIPRTLVQEFLSDDFWTRSMDLYSKDLW